MPDVGTMVCFSLGRGRKFGVVHSHSGEGFWILSDYNLVFYPFAIRGS